MRSHHNCFAEKLICSHNYTTFTTAAVPRSVQTFLLVHYFSIQCLCLGKVLVFAGNSFAGHLFQSPILSSLTRGSQGAVLLERSRPLRAALQSLPSLQFSTSRTKNLVTMRTLTTQYRGCDQTPTELQ